MGRPRGLPDYPPLVRRAAAFSVLTHASQSFRYKLSVASNANKKKLLAVGCTGDPLLKKGWQSFKALQWDDAALRAAAHRLNKTAFRRLAMRWLLKDPNCISDFETRRQHPDGCTEKQLERAAEVLGTPYRPDGSVRYWTSVQECIDESPQGAELQVLQRKSGKSPEAFGDFVLERCADIVGWGPADRRGEMAERTAAERQFAADVWAGRAPWMVINDEGEVRRFDPAHDDADPPPGTHYEYFNERSEVIFKNFTFMIDATTMTNQSGADKNRVKAFVSKRVAHPPELVRAGTAATRESKVMGYIVIHPHLGLVLGPDIMHHGTSGTGGRQEKNAGEKHDPSFPTWCANSATTSCTATACMAAQLLC